MSEAITIEDRKRIWAEWLDEVKADILDKAAAQGNDNTLDITIESSIWAMTQRAQHVEQSTYQDPDFHLWANMIIQAAKSYHYTNPKQGAVVLSILRARELGTIARPIVDSQTGVQTLIPCTTTTGARVLSDLPFLVEDIEREWLGKAGSLPVGERANLIGFIGRLVAVGLSDRLAVCALQLFRDVFETARPLRASEATTQGEVSVMELLPAVGAWLFTHFYKTHTMVRRGVQFDSAHAAPGELASRSGITGNGFSDGRWQFWMHRLREINSQLSAEEKGQVEMAAMMERLGDSLVKVFVEA